MNNEKFMESNRRLWNTRTPLHLRSKFYDVAAFKAGSSSLTEIETTQLGDVAGKRLLHLQCHFGLDTLSWARRGAYVTGVDFSSVAVDSARKLSSDLQIPASFLCCNVLDVDQILEESFDIVFTSYGVLGWLPDLNRWAQVIHSALSPQGIFYMVEFHSCFYRYNEQGELTYEYRSAGEPDYESVSSTYADELTHEPRDEFWWNHTTSDIINSVTGNGMQLKRFDEFPFSPYRLGDAMVEAAPGQWIYKSVGNRIPYVFSLQAERAH